MTVLLAFAFVSGVITILSPCILPVLPIVLSGGVGRGRARPLGVVAGFVVSFTFFTLALTAIVGAIGIPVDALRYVAVGMIVILGLVMIVPQLRDRFELLTSRLAGRVSQKGAKTPASSTPGEEPRLRAAGFWNGIPVGLSLGLVWTPCVGPIMASVISLALTQQVDGGAIFITLAYTLGTSIPMLAIMVGGRALLTRVPFLSKNTARIQKGFGVVMILVGVAIGFGWDRQFQNAILTAVPGYGAGLTGIEDSTQVLTALDVRDGRDGSQFDVLNGERNAEALTISASDRPEGGDLADYGAAPALVAEGPWFNLEELTTMNGESLSMEDLKGKVVLLDFWTYSCINCVRTIPYLRSWYDAYKDDGLVIIGVHTPEFEFEKNPTNVEKAIGELGVTWPVVLDNSWVQWRAYSNRYWPAHYFIDATGRVRYYQFGEGKYDIAEQVIRDLLEEAGAVDLYRTVSNVQRSNSARTPETYLGYGRAKGLQTTTPVVPNSFAEYNPSLVPGNGEWTLEGSWNISREFIIPESAGALEIGFNAKNVFLVIEPGEEGGQVEVFVDGKTPANTDDVRRGMLYPSESRLYQLVGTRRAGEHILRLEVEGELRLFAFTFG